MMKLEKFKEKNRKRTGMIVFTIICILLVSGVILYRTFAIFEVKTHQNVIKGTVQDPGNLYFAFYVDDKIEKMMPQKNEGYIFDEENSYCGVLGNKDNSISLDFDKDKWNVTVSGLKESRTKCNLHFVKGAYILGKPVKAVTSGDGLYEVPHGDEVLGTLNDNGFKETEWRYAGASPHNYIKFNDEAWRIIGLVNVITSENTVEQRVKIVRDESIGNFVWNKDKVNDWSKSSLMNMLNNGYYYASSNVDCYTSNNQEQPIVSSYTCDFSENGNEPKGMNELAKKMIDEDIIWNLGKIDSNYSKVLSKDWYFLERKTIANNNQPSEWKKESESGNVFHSIGLIYPSDYGYATSGGTLGRDQCFNGTLYNIGESQIQCVNNNWLKPNNGDTWTITTNSHNNLGAFRVTSSGGINNPFVTESHNVFPTLYLKPNIQIVNNDQDGSKESPFHLIQQS